MKEYKLYIGLPTAKFNEFVKAQRFTICEGRINFYIDNELSASYPSQYTIIEKIKDV